MSADLTYSVLKSCLSGKASLSDINTLVSIAHRMALVHLRQVINSGRLHLHSFPILLESVALDCIAEVFERDEEGRFVELEDYFSCERNLDFLKSDDALFHLRTFVFKKLSDGIFRLYRENDPVLSRIIRNLKIASTKTLDVRQIEKFGELYLLFGAEEEAEEHQPEFPVDELEREFAKTVSRTNSATEHLRTFCRIFRQQQEYRKTYALTDLAVVIKRAIVRSQSNLSEAVVFQDHLTRVDLTALVQESYLRFVKDLHNRYVRPGKLDEKTFMAYASALEDMLQDTFILSDGSEREYFEYLQRHFPELTRSAYTHLHRTKFEYMAKLGKKAIRNKLRDLL